MSDRALQITLSVGVPTVAVLDDAKETWRAELRRVEMVIDARLKQPEER